MLGELISNEVAWFLTLGKYEFKMDEPVNNAI